MNLGVSVLGFPLYSGYSYSFLCLKTLLKLMVKAPILRFLLITVFLGSMKALQACYRLQLFHGFTYYVRLALREFGVWGLATSGFTNGPRGCGGRMQGCRSCMGSSLG